MKPVAIFRHSPIEGPGYFADFLDQRRIPWRLVAVDEGVAIPESPAAFSGLVFMGGPMSVNDDLPWIPPVLTLIRSAVAADVPVLGHCLGGQLMAKSLGGVVSRNPVKEIGWGEVRVVDGAPGRDWLGPSLRTFVSFHWHGETFSIPQGGEAILESDHCRNQAFALGKHLGLQCHVEMTEELVRSWCAAGAREIERHGQSPGVQPVDAILQELEGRLSGLHAVADILYSRWLRGLA